MGRGVMGLSNTDPLSSGCRPVLSLLWQGAGLGQGLPCREVWAPDGLLPFMFRTRCSLDQLQAIHPATHATTNTMLGCQMLCLMPVKLGNKRASAQPTEGWGGQVVPQAITCWCQARGGRSCHRGQSWLSCFSRWLHSRLSSDVTYSERPSLTAPFGLVPPCSLHILCTLPLFLHSTCYSSCICYSLPQ